VSLIKVIVSGPANSGKSAVIRLIMGIFRAAHLNFELKNPQEVLTSGDLNTGEPYERLRAKNPRIFLIEDRSQAYDQVPEPAELQAFKEDFPTALWVPSKRCFHERDHSVAYGAWSIGRAKLRLQLNKS
jgi:hypothetical protein